MTSLVHSCANQPNLVVGETESPLIFLLLIAFAGGAMVVFLLSIARDAERRLIEKRMRASMRRGAELQEFEVE